MELTISLRGLTLFVHNLFWWLLTLALISRASWMPVAFLIIFSIQTLLMLVWVLKGPTAIGLALTEPKEADGVDSSGIPTRIRMQ